MIAAPEDVDVQRVFHSRDQTRAFYNKISRVYDLLAEKDEGPVRRAALGMLAAAEDENVLEIGFGTGHCLVALAEAVGPAGTVHGVDLSDGMLEQALARVVQGGLADRVRLCRDDAADLPYNNESFDAVFASFALELFDTPEIPEVLAECRRVLRPDGRIVLASLSKSGNGGFAVHAFEWTHEHFPNLLDCRPIFLRRAVEAAGFTIEKTRMMYMWVPVEIVLARKPIA